MVNVTIYIYSSTIDPMGNLEALNFMVEHYRHCKSLHVSESEVLNYSRWSTLWVTPIWAISWKINAMQNIPESDLIPLPLKLNYTINAKICVHPPLIGFWEVFNIRAKVFQESPRLCTTQQGQWPAFVGDYPWNPGYEVLGGSRMFWVVWQPKTTKQIVWESNMNVP